MVTSEDGKVSTYYMHLDSFADINQGDYVKEGTIIGYIGGSGAGIQDKYSPHLHYEVIIDGVHVNPVIGDNILLDPQKIDAPIYLGMLNLAKIEDKLTLNTFEGYILERPVQPLSLLTN